MGMDELNVLAREYGIKNFGSMTKSQAVFEIVKTKSERPDEMLVGEGVLEVLPDGFGFLRSPTYNTCLLQKIFMSLPHKFEDLTSKRVIRWLHHSFPERKREILCSSESR